MNRKVDKIEKGQIVCSLAGRDKGRFFVVLGVRDGYAFIADGSLRPLEKPKRKKPRHLAPAGRRIELPADARGNRELRKLLAALCPGSRDGKTLESERDTGGHELVKE